jgi:HEAT repeat protein
LGGFGPAAAFAVDALGCALADPDESVQVAAIEALAAIGPAARPAVPLLQRARGNRQAGLGRHVLAALGRIEGEADQPFAPR